MLTLANASHFLKTALILSVGLCAALSTPAIGAEQIRIAVDEWPPFQSRTEKHYGGAHRIISEAFAREGVEVAYDWFPWKRALKYVEEGRWESAALSQRNAENESNYYFSEPVMTVEKVFFHLKDFDFQWKDVNDLEGIVLAVRRGYLYGKPFHDAWRAGRLRTLELDTDELLFQKLIEGRVQLAIAERETLNSVLRSRFPGRLGQVIQHPRPLQRVTYHVIFSKKSERSKGMCDRFNRGLRPLKKQSKDRQYLREAMAGKYKHQGYPR